MIQLLRRRQAAEYLQARYGFCTEKTLSKLATLGGGPAYQKAGKFPLYDPENLDAWAQAKLSPLVRSTSEYPPKAA